MSKMAGFATISLHKRGFVSLELAIVLGFLFIVASSVLFLANPIERAKQKHDTRLREDSQKILEAINKFYISRGRVPWANQIDTQQLSPVLSWKPLSDPQVGICSDTLCVQPGELVLAGLLNESFIHLDSVLGRNGIVYLGKAVGPNALLYTCFLPEAAQTRGKTGELFKIKVNDDFPKTGTLPSCPSNITWGEDDVCYVCLTN